MVRIRPPKLKNPPPVIAPKLKPAKPNEVTAEVALSAESIGEGMPTRAPILKAKTKNVKGAFAKEKVKATPKAKVKLTHQEKQAARREQRQASKLAKKEAFQAEKKAAKKAKRTARRNAESRKSAGRTITTK